MDNTFNEMYSFQNDRLSENPILLNGICDNLWLRLSEERESDSLASNALSRSDRMSRQEIMPPKKHHLANITLQTPLN